MLKDINGVDIPKDIHGDEITIESLQELMSYRYDKEELKNVIGFARYNPIRIGEHRFVNKLDRKCWYPIEKFSKKEKTVFNLVGYNNSHFGIFDHIVPLKGHEHKFEHLKKSNPEIEKYWNAKIKENEDRIRLREESSKRFKIERKEYEEIKKQMGKKPKRLTKVNQVLNKSRNFKTSELFKEMVKDPEFELNVKADIEWRLRSIYMFKKIDKEKGYRYNFHNTMDYKLRKRIEELQNKINSFDFTTTKGISKIEREERFEQGEASILDILSKKTKELTQNFTKSKNKRKI